MKLKTIITVVLLLFIFASVAYLVVKEVHSGSKSSSEQTNLPTVTESNEPSLATEARKESSSRLSGKVVFYYFHGTARCPTCRKFESYSNAALQEAFAEVLNNGRLEWRVVNVDKPGNEHFVDDYQLYSRSIVIVKMRDGKQAEWKNLKKIWELVRNKRAFVKYIQDEIRAYLEAE